MIRPQRPDDAPAVHALLLEAFADEPEVAGLEAALDERADSTGFVADAGGEVLGHVRLTRGWVDAPEALVPVLVLSPLSVRPDHHGQGIGRALVAHALGTFGYLEPLTSRLAARRLSCGLPGHVA